VREVCSEILQAKWHVVPLVAGMIKPLLPAMSQPSREMHEHSGPKATMLLLSEPVSVLIVTDSRHVLQHSGAAVCSLHAMKGRAVSSPS
jgi:hypothetical protein